jgi:cellulose synthase/poly-beta-1,6-N-acetylglucosamine synthase-like glycosyltransferase
MRQVLAIIPSHNEALNLPLLMKGLKVQTHPIDICIVSDNSTDRTVELARELGATIVTETIGNTGMRSGAINHGLDHFAKGYDYILAMDADSTCAKDMIEQMVNALESDSKLGAVCSRAGVLPQELETFEQMLLWHLAHVEYATYDASRVETTGKIKIAHGLATMYRAEALEQQKTRKGYVYNINALTEDYELTVDLKELGWKITSCQKAKAWTVVPTTFKWLWKQRSRWGLGAIDTLVTHKISKITIWDWITRITTLGMLAVQLILIGAIAYLAIQGEHIYLSWLFVAVWGACWLNGIYRFRYVQNPDKWDALLVLTMLPIQIYELYLMATELNAYKQFIQKAKRAY